MTRWVVALLVVAAVTASPAAGTSAQSPKPGGTVVFGPVSEPVCLSPLELSCVSGPHVGWIWEKVLPPAFVLGPDFRRRPALVSEVVFTRTAPFTLTYTIRREARWSDGVPVTAGDFLFSHRVVLRQLSQDTLGALHRLVRAIRVVNSKTFRVTLRGRTADWRTLFTLVLPRHALAVQNLARIWTDRIDNPRTGRPIGSGPFLVERWERGKQLTLVRNPRYWGPHAAYLDRLVIRFCQQACAAPPPDEVYERLRTGAVDIAFARDTEIVPNLRGIRGTKVTSLRSNGWEHLTLRLGPGGHPALRNKLVRRALAHAIDRAEIVRRLWGGIDPSQRPLHSAVLLGSARGYAPNWRDYTYRPARARSLLARAGCRPGADGIYVCGGERLSLRFLTISGARQRERGLELVQAQLRRAGVEVSLAFVTFPALFDQILPGGEFDGVSFAWINLTDGGYKDVYGCGGVQNFSGYCQRIVTAELDQADRILDDAQRARVLNRADRQLAKDVPVIPLYQIPWVLAHKGSVRNVVPSPNNIFWNAENWWLAEQR